MSVGWPQERHRACRRMTTVSTTEEASVIAHSSRIRRWLALPGVQVCVLVVILAGASIQEATRLSALTNQSLWLQLAVGNWIVEHHAAPQVGVLSQSANMPWADPNWGFQVVLALLDQVMGMRALPFMVMALRLLLAFMIFILAGGRRGNFWLAAGIAVWAQVGLLNLSVSPLGLLSAVFLALELSVLRASRDSGKWQRLLAIPVLVCVWANFDWHFVIGVAILCLYGVVCGIERYLRTQGWDLLVADTPVPPARPGIIGGVAVLASLASPSFYHSYVTAWRNLFGDSPLGNSLALKSLSFREPTHYLLMFLAMFAFFLIGRQRARDLFQIVLLVGGVCFGVALGTETWIVAVASTAVIGKYFMRADESGTRLEPLSGKAIALAVTIAAVAIVTTALTRIPSGPVLLESTEKVLPVRACDFIRTNHLPGPLFNQLEWGGFVAWYLPDHPVAIDDRYELYGEEKTKQYYGVTQGKVDPASDGDLTSANTVLLSTDNVLIKGPEIFPDSQRMFQITFPGFHEVYRDQLAVVLTKQQ